MNNIGVKRMALALAFASLLIAAVVSFTEARAKTTENGRRIEAIEQHNGEAMIMLRRIDKRQALIMHKLDIRDASE